jgi:hypothetical protein
VFTFVYYSKDEGRRTREEGRGAKEEGRRAKDKFELNHKSR